MSVERGGVKGGFGGRCEGSNKGGELSVNKGMRWIGAGEYIMVIVRLVTLCKYALSQVEQLSSAPHGF